MLEQSKEKQRAWHNRHLTVDAATHTGDGGVYDTKNCHVIFCKR